MNRYYVYAYCNADDALYISSKGSLPGTPFYVGRGVGGRWLAHLGEALGTPSKKPNHLKLSAIKKIVAAGQLPVIIKVAEHLTREEADAIETALIAEIGTIANVFGVEKRGPLTNLKTGGTGGYTHRTEAGALAISKAASLRRKGVPISEKHAEALHNGGKNRVRTPEENAKRGAAIAAAFTPETHAKRIKTRQENGWYSPEALEHRAELVAAGALRPTEETKKQISEKTRVAMTNEGVRAKMRDSAAKRWSNPAEVQKIRDRNSKTFELVHRITGERFIIKNMTAFCRDNKTYHQKVYREYAVTLVE